jgi:hypothetical protein
VRARAEFGKRMNAFMMKASRASESHPVALAYTPLHRFFSRETLLYICCVGRRSDISDKRILTCDQLKLTSPGRPRARLIAVSVHVWTSHSRSGSKNENRQGKRKTRVFVCSRRSIGVRRLYEDPHARTERRGRFGAQAGPAARHLARRRLFDLCAVRLLQQGRPA